MQIDASSQLTDRQRAIIRAYFAHGCRTLRTAQGLGITACRVRQVKALPGAAAYLHEMEQAAITAMCQAKAAQILAPML